MTNKSSAISIKRNLYKGNRLSIDFFMYTPQALFNQNSYTINVNPIVTFRYTNPNIMKDDKVSYTDNSYKMTPKNQHKLIRFFNTIIDWFYDEKLKDLFLINENEELVFNSDYNHINAVLTKNKFETGVLKAMPSVIMIENERYEGIYLYINKLDNIIMLTRDELEAIAQMIKNFNFTLEVSSSLIMIDHIEKNNDVVTDVVSWNKNGKFNGSVSSPFDKK